MTHLPLVDVYLLIANKSSCLTAGLATVADVGVSVAGRARRNLALSPFLRDQKSLVLQSRARFFRDSCCLGQSCSPKPLRPAEHRLELGYEGNRPNGTHCRFAYHFNNSLSACDYIAGRAWLSRQRVTRWKGPLPQCHDWSILWCKYAIG